MNDAITKSVLLKLDPALHYLFQQACKARGQTMASVLRTHVVEVIREHRNEIEPLLKPPHRREIDT